MCLRMGSLGCFGWVRRPETGIETVHFGIWVIAACEFVEHIEGYYTIFHGGDVGSTVSGGLGFDGADLLFWGHGMGVEEDVY